MRITNSHMSYCGPRRNRYYPPDNTNGLAMQRIVRNIHQVVLRIQNQEAINAEPIQGRVHQIAGNEEVLEAPEDENPVEEVVQDQVQLQGEEEVQAEPLVEVPEDENPLIQEDNAEVVRIFEESFLAFRNTFDQMENLLFPAENVGNDELIQRRQLFLQNWFQNGGIVLILRQIEDLRNLGNQFNIDQAFQDRLNEIEREANLYHRVGAALLLNNALNIRG